MQNSAAKAGLWLLALAGVSRLSSVVAYGVLAALLSADAFGIYAVVASISVLAMVFRDAGVRDLLIVASEETLHDRFGSYVLTAAVSNSALAVLLVAVSDSVATFYGSDQIPFLLYFVAAQLVLGTGWSVSSGLLRRQLRFADVAIIETVGVAIQFGGAVFLATRGLGAASLVVPLPIAAAVRSVLGLRRSRNCWSYWETSEKRFDASVAKDAGWVILGAGMLGLLSNVDYLIFGRRLTQHALGIYYFGFQIAAQIFTVVASVVVTVSLPKMAQAKSERLSFLSMRSAEIVASGSAIAGAAIILVFPYIDRLLWGGKWAPSYPIAAIYAVTTPLTLLYTVNQSRLTAGNQWRRWASTVSAMSAGLAVVAFAAISYTDTPKVLAACVGLYLAAVGILNMVSVARALRLDSRTMASRLVTAWAIPYLVCGSILIVLNYLSPTAPLLAAAGSSVAYCLGTLAAYRGAHPKLLSDLVDLLPAPLSRKVRTVLGINHVLVWESGGGR